MPIAARRSGGTEACVIVAGCEISVSTPPRLSASAMQPDAVQQPPRRLERAERRTTASRRSRASAASPARAADATGRPGIVDVLHLRVRRAGTRRAPGRWRCAALHADRQRLGAAQHQPRIERAEDRALRRSARTCSHSMSSSRTATTTPPTLSLWPLRYLVVLCDDQVGAELDRPLEVRAREGVVDDQPRRRGGARARPPRADVGEPHAPGWSASRRTASASPA